MDLDAKPGFFSYFLNLKIEQNGLNALTHMPIASKTILLPITYTMEIWIGSDFLWMNSLLM